MVGLSHGQDWTAQYPIKRAAGAARFVSFLCRNLPKSCLDTTTQTYIATFIPGGSRIAVVDAQDSMTPTLAELECLVDSTPWAPPDLVWGGPARLYKRIKHGYRNVLVAVVDHGVINYMRYAEAAFGEELLFPRYDQRKDGGAKRGGKRGSRGNRGNRGRGRSGR
jgi:hypothetical protein